MNRLAVSQVGQAVLRCEAASLTVLVSPGHCRGNHPLVCLPAKTGDRAFHPNPSACRGQRDVLSFGGSPNHRSSRPSRGGRLVSAVGTRRASLVDAQPAGVPGDAEGIHRTPHRGRVQCSVSPASAFHQPTSKRKCSHGAASVSLRRIQFRSRSPPRTIRRQRPHHPGGGGRP